MTEISYEIKAEPVGFILYASHNGEKLNLARFCNVTNYQVLEVTKKMATVGGFQAEPEDALAFFLFEDRAQAFIDSVNE